MKTFKSVTINGKKLKIGDRVNDDKWDKINKQKPSFMRCELENTRGWICSRPEGHEGKHVAHGFSICEIWTE